MNYGVIYMHKNKTNEKVYIGQTTNNPKYRWNHGEGYKESPYFYEAIKKYGWDGFEHIILESDIEEKELNNREKYWIDFYHSNLREYGYNLTNGGTERLNNEQKEKRKIKLAQWRENNPELSNKAINSMKQYWLDNPKEKEKILKKATLKSLEYWKNNPEKKEKVMEKMREKAKEVRSKPVKCIETNICYFSASEAARQLSISKSSISRAAKGETKTCNNCHWIYITKEEYNLCKLEKEMGE